jgi:hypothetical protein
VINYFHQWKESSTKSIRAAVGKVAEELQADDPIKRLSLHDAERRITVACSMAVTTPGPLAVCPRAPSPWTEGTHYTAPTTVAMQA